MAVTVSCSVVAGAEARHLPAFLASLRESAQRRPDIRLHVQAVINAPERTLADSVSTLADTVVVRDTPVGFAANHNEMLRMSEAEFHIIANDDVLVQGDCVGLLVDALRQPDAARVAVISPVLRNPDGSLQPSTYSFPTVPSAILSMTGIRERMPQWLAVVLARVFRRSPGASRMWLHDRVRDVDTLRGAFVIVRRAAIAEVGMMSEVALVGGEEVEWHRRFAAAGWRVRLFPHAAVTHIGRVTTGGRRDLDVEYLKGTANFFRLHGSRLQFELVRLVARVRLLQLMRRERRETGHEMQLHRPYLSELKFSDRRP